jgi:thiamine transport system permease protein
MLAAVPLAFLALFFFYPLLSILAVGLAPSADGSVGQVLRDPYIAELFLFTAGQALVSTVLALVVGLPASYVLGAYRFRGRSVFLALATLPFVLPTVVVAAALLAVVGQSGVVNTLLGSVFGPNAPKLQLENTVALIIMAHVFYNTPVVLRIMTTHWMTRDRRPEEAARLLGARPWQVWWRVRLPLALPSILSSALLVAIFTFTSFGVVLLLGGARIATVEVEIYRQARNYFDLRTAAVLSILQMIFMSALMLVFARIDRAAAASGTPVVELRRPRRVGERLAVGVTVAGLSLLLIAPLLMLALQSVTSHNGSFTLTFYAQLFEHSRRAVLTAAPIESILQSLLIAGVAVVLAVILGGLTAAALWRARGATSAALNVIVLLPLSASAVLLGLGFVIALDEPPLNLRTAWILLPIAHALVAIPLVVRSLSPALRALSPETGEAAALLGAPPVTIWRRIYLPMARAALIVGALFAFTVSMGEFGATLFVSRPEWTTMPLAIYRLLGQPGASNYGQALALSTVLLGVCAIAYLGMERLRGEGQGGL